jgi:hypothetical protein
MLSSFITLLCDLTFAPIPTPPCRYWQNAERDFGELAKYYSLPEVQQQYT